MRPPPPTPPPAKWWRGALARCFGQCLQKNGTEFWINLPFPAWRAEGLGVGAGQPLDDREFAGIVTATRKASQPLAHSGMWWGHPVLTYLGKGVGYHEKYLSSPSLRHVGVACADRAVIARRVWRSQHGDQYPGRDQVCCHNWRRADHGSCVGRHDCAFGGWVSGCCRDDRSRRCRKPRRERYDGSRRCTRPT